MGVQRKLTRREQRKAEAESEHRTVADCITYGGNFGEEMEGEREARANRRKLKSEKKAKEALGNAIKPPAVKDEEEEKKEAPTKPGKKGLPRAQPRVEIVNGQTVIHEIQAITRDEIVQATTAGRERVDKKNERLSTLRYIVGKDPCDRWSKADTDKFFASLQLFGTDFGMIESQVFAGKRTRNQIRKKFNKEQKQNEKKVNALLKDRITMADFEDRFGKIQGPNEEEDDEPISEESSVTSSQRQCLQGSAG